MKARRGETVVLAAGDFPKRGGEAWRLLAGAKRVVCCDGAADAYVRRMKKPPAAVVGDLDSWCGRAPEGSEIIRIAEQETNDLAKAVRLCEERGWRNPVVLGATGRREDHTLGNVFRAMEFGLEVVTDFGRFIPVDGEARIRVAKGTPVSIFATNPATRMTSKGLQWPLEGVRFGNLYCATLNRAVSSVVTLTSTSRVYVYIAF